MGRGRKGACVEIRERSIRLRFMWKGERCYETLELAPTPPNIKYANRLMADIRRQIELGTFDYSAYFPDSSRAQQSECSHVVTLREIGRKWLEAHGANLPPDSGTMKVRQLIQMLHSFDPEARVDLRG